MAGDATPDPEPTPTPAPVEILCSTFLASAEVVENVPTIHLTIDIPTA